MNDYILELQKKDFRASIKDLKWKRNNISRASQGNVTIYTYKYIAPVPFIMCLFKC